LAIAASSLLACPRACVSCSLKPMSRASTALKSSRILASAADVVAAALVAALQSKGTSKATTQPIVNHHTPAACVDGLGGLCMLRQLSSHRLQLGRRLRATRLQ
jgi:hypothetical protein